MHYIISHLIQTAILCLLGIILIEYVPSWLNIKGGFAMILKVIGVLIIIAALLSWF